MNAVLGAASRNATYIIGALLLIPLLGAAFGLLKKSAASLFSASLNAGETIVAKFMEKPRAVVLLLIAVALIVPSFGIGYGFGPEKIVEKTIKVFDPDNPELASLRDSNSKAEAIKVSAEARARNTEALLSEARALIGNMIREKQEADRKVAELNQKLADASPSGDRVKIEAIAKNYDQLHSTAIASEFESLKKRRLSTSQFVEEFSSSGSALYHKNCAICSRNSRILTEMSPILSRHPGWSAFYWEDKKEDPKLVEQRQHVEAWKAGMAKTLLKPITAFGETKSGNEWLKDPMFAHGADADEFAIRIEQGWEPPKAIEMSLDEGRRYWEVVRKRNYEKQEAEKERRRAIEDWKDVQTPGEPLKKFVYDDVMIQIRGDLAYNGLLLPDRTESEKQQHTNGKSFAGMTVQLIERKKYIRQWNEHQQDVPISARTYYLKDDGIITKTPPPSAK